MAGAEFYFGNDDLGKRLFLLGRNGAKANLWNPDISQYVDVVIPPGGGVEASLFDDTAYVDGIPEQSLQEGKAYYAYGFLPVGGGSGLPKMNFTNQGFDGVNRYVMNVGNMNPARVPEWVDPQGNKCLLAGMCYVLNDPVIGLTVRSVPFGYPPSSPSSPRWLCSPSPWNDSPAQPLPATTGQAGGAIIGAAMHEINQQYHRITSCYWAWRGPWSMLEGFAWSDTANSEINAQIRCRNLAVPGSLYQAVQAPATVTCIAAGQKVPIRTHSALALDDGVYEFSFWASCSTGNASYNVTHTLHGWGGG